MQAQKVASVNFEVGVRAEPEAESSKGAGSAFVSTDD